MTMSELATIVENNLPVKFAIFNNGNLGMVRQWQEVFYNKDYFATWYTRNPDFVKLAEAFGMMGTRVTDRSQSIDAIRDAMAHPGPALVEFVLVAEENVYPMIPSGMTVKDMIEEHLVEKVKS